MKPLEGLSLGNQTETGMIPSKKSESQNQWNDIGYGEKGKVFLGRGLSGALVQGRLGVKEQEDLGLRELAMSFRSLGKS